VKSYPTLIYYPKNNKKGISYAGGRELADFKTYLTENSASYKAFTTKSAEPVQTLNEEL